MKLLLLPLVLVGALAGAAPAVANPAFSGCFDLSDEATLCFNVEPERYGRGYYNDWDNRDRYPWRQSRPYRDGWESSCGNYNVNPDYLRYPGVRDRVRHIHHLECEIQKWSDEIKYLRDRRAQLAHQRYDRERLRSEQSRLDHLMRQRQAAIRESQSSIAELKRSIQQIVQRERQREAYRRRYHRY